ncbi:hypothetical protein D3C78_1234700 [compost metagenome]
MQTIEVVSETTNGKFGRVKTNHLDLEAVLFQPGTDISRSFFLVDVLDDDLFTRFVLTDVLVDRQQVVRDFVFQRCEQQKRFLGLVAHPRFVEQCDVHEQQHNEIRLEVVLQCSGGNELATAECCQITQYPIEAFPAQLEGAVSRQGGLHRFECFFHALGVIEVQAPHFSRVTGFSARLDIRIEFS